MHKAGADCSTAAQQWARILLKAALVDRGPGRALAAGEQQISTTTLTEE
jgi:hypothetical protein